MSDLYPFFYTGPTDLQAMIALTQALRARGQKVYPIAADLYEELSEPVVQTTVRLWRDGQSQLVGFAYVNQYQNLVDVFDERAFTPALKAEAMAWAVIAVQRRNQEQGISQALDASTL